MKIIHIVTSINRINFGVWNAAIFGSKYLMEQHNVDSELLVCKESFTQEIEPDISYRCFKQNNMKVFSFLKLLKGLDKKNTIIVTHGAWLLPTRLGFLARLMGYKWVTVPHGMHEPWEANKGLKKWVYFYCLERPMLRFAHIIKAVSNIEKINLEKKLNRSIVTVYNGVEMKSSEPVKKTDNLRTFLFMARLQRKKGIIHLVRAWSEVMKNEKSAVLKIAGPDEGELDKIKPYFSDNIQYLGPVYGNGKELLLKEAHYYVMPSYSEGFPTSIVEAMSFGAIPIITDGCNFPQVFENNLGYKIKPDSQSVSDVLVKLKDIEYNWQLSHQNQLFIFNNFTDRKIGADLYKMYLEILK